MNHLTDDQLNRLYGNVYHRIMRCFEGGNAYGVDWPTLKASSPSWYKTIKMVVDEGRRRRQLPGVFEL